MSDFDALAKRLAPHYSRFRVAERLLFTGHSHQAWPDVAADGMAEAFAAAATLVDDKWPLAFEKADVLRRYLRGWYDDPQGCYCLAPNTHALLVSWLSALDYRGRHRIITTDGEFHSLYRQLHRLREEGLDVVMVSADSMTGLVERIADAATDTTLAIMLSRVMFETALVNEQLTAIARLARERSIPLLIDDYHGTNVVPLSLREQDLEDCFLVTGGYKYLQWGEGNCFLRYPAGCELRPAITGWYAAFADLQERRAAQRTAYEDEQRFAGATYDPTPQFRAAKVVAFFESQGLSPAVLREQYLAQLGLLRELILRTGCAPEVLCLAHDQPLTRNGGFLALCSPHAKVLQQALAQRGVRTDARGDVLRFGVAPYIGAAQIERAAAVLGECVGALG